MNQHRITPLTESGLLTALTVVLAMAAFYLPIVGIAAALLWALPVIVLVVRHGLRWGIMAVFAAGVIMAVLIEPLLSLRMVISFAPAGLLLGYGFRRAWPGAKTFGLALFSSIVGKLLALALIFAVTAVNPLNMEMEAVRETFAQTFQLYESAGVDPETLAKSREEIQAGLDMLKLLLPLLVILMGLFDTAVGYLVGTRVLRRLGHAVPQLPPFAKWRLPAGFLYLFGFSLVGLYWGGAHDIPWLYQISLNGDMLAIFAGLVQGLSLTHCLMRHYKLSLFVRTAIYVMLLLNSFLAQLVALTGLMDMLFDYRRRFARRDEK